MKLENIKDGDIVIATSDNWGNEEEAVNFYCYPSKNIFKTLVDTKTRTKGEYYLIGLSVYKNITLIDNIFTKKNA